MQGEAKVNQIPACYWTVVNQVRGERRERESFVETITFTVPKEEKGSGKSEFIPNSGRFMENARRLVNESKHLRGNHGKYYTYE